MEPINTYIFIEATHNLHVPVSENPALAGTRGAELLPFHINLLSKISKNQQKSTVVFLSTFSF